MDIQKLIEENDLYNINLTINNDILNVDMIFIWKEDYGIFSKKKRSDLTILTSKDLWEKIQNDIDNKKGIVYKYILNHKLYVGELLDFYKINYKGEFYGN